VKNRAVVIGVVVAVLAICSSEYLVTAARPRS